MRLSCRLKLKWRKYKEIKLFFLYSDISLASFSSFVTKNSAPANAELFIPKISTGIEAEASFNIFPSLI